MDTDSMDLWGSYKNEVLQVYNELCEKTKAREDQRNTQHMVVERASKGCDRSEKESVLTVLHESISGK